MSRILCLSGGMDSVIAWYYLGKPPCIYFHVNVPYSNKERDAIAKLGIPTKIDYSLNFSEELGSYIPHRNLLFASRASAHATEVVIAGLKDDKVEDKTEGAFRTMSACLSSIGREPVMVTSPFWQKTKEDIVKWFVANVPEAEEQLELSVSCYSGRGQEPCWECTSCFRKACALATVGIKKPFYAEDLKTLYWYRAEQGYYDRDRCKSILNYLRG